MAVISGLPTAKYIRLLLEDALTQHIARLVGIAYPVLNLRMNGGR
jgi:hypothetical protein